MSSLGLLPLEAIDLAAVALLEMGNESDPRRYAHRVIDEATLQAVGRLLGLSRGAVSRFVLGVSSGLFALSEITELAEAFAAPLAVGDALGRATQLATTIQILLRPGVAPMPRLVVDYLRALPISLGRDPFRLAPDMRRRAFTLAAATSEEIAAKVRDAIAERLATGEPTSGPAAIRAILDASGVSSRNSQYADMVFRTNAIDAYNQGGQDELSKVADAFLVWRYAAVADSRSRPTHAAKDGNYYPSSVPFVQVRGVSIADAANCRCTFIPIDKWQWAKLRSQGARIADGYPDVPA